MSGRGGGRGRSIVDPDTHARIVPSGSPRSEDGYFEHEPKWLECPECGARVQLTEDPDDPSWEELPHKSGCSQRDVKSRWWWERFAPVQD